MTVAFHKRSLPLLRLGTRRPEWAHSLASCHTYRRLCFATTFLLALFLCAEVLATAGHSSPVVAWSAESTQKSSAPIPVGGERSVDSPGWHVLPYTKLSDVCADNADLHAVEGCSAIIADWNSGIADTKRNRLIFWGGGHAGYAGNEVYALDLEARKMVRLTNPSLPPVKCVAALSNPPGPNSRHTYDGLAYIEDADQMFVFGGAAYRGNDNCRPSPDPEFVGYGGRMTDTWTLDLEKLQWMRRDPTKGKGRPATDYQNLGEGVVADYDPVSKKVIVGDTAAWYSYDAKTNTYAHLNHRALFSYLMTGAIDPERRLFVLFGGGQARAFDLQHNSLLNWDQETKGCAAIQNTSYPGVTYDSAQKKIVGWAGGDAVYVFDPTTKVCTPVNFPEGPGNQQGNGTLGRFRYFPALGVFALINDWKQDAYVLRLTPRGSVDAGKTPHEKQ